MPEKWNATQVGWFKDFLRLLANSMIEPMALDLAAHKMVINALRTQFSDLDASLAAARDNSAVRDSVRTRYHEPLERFLQSISGEFLQEEVEKWLQAQKATDSDKLN